MGAYRPTIGLEIHAELQTATKMFCACLNNPDEELPNKNICPICMAHPGTLPVINKEAVHKVLLVGAALGGTLADYTEFDRKNYFYPDIPKGYQISQYQHPLVLGGSLGGVALTRIHLEEDTARLAHRSTAEGSQHVEDTDKGGAERSLVDYNRAGVPLMELVTEPVIHDAETASAFARELQLLLRYLEVGEANMEKGEMRVEANISVAPIMSAVGINQKDVAVVLGTKVEVKNLNSFRSVERAICYEIARQTKLLDSGEDVVQETRGWDEAKQATFSQRKKEKEHDYRYFPDPDLPKLLLSKLHDFAPGDLRRAMPELPWVRRGRYKKLGLKEDDADMFVKDPLLGNFFDTFSTQATQSAALLGANYLASDLAGKVEKGDLSRGWFAEKTNAERFLKLMHLVEIGTLSSRGAKDTLALMCASGKDPETLAKERGLIQQSDEGMIDTVANRLVANYPHVVEDYKAGKQAALQFLVGQGMKETKGSANPGLLRESLLKILG